MKAPQQTSQNHIFDKRCLEKIRCVEIRQMISENIQRIADTSVS